MARITVEDCIDQFESRFELVLVASNRARKLHSGESPTVEQDNDKPTVIALREIADESIPINSLKDKLIEEYQTVSLLEEEEELSLDYTGSETESKDEISENENNFNVDNNEADILNEETTNEDGGLLNAGNDEDNTSHPDEDGSILTQTNDEDREISDLNSPESQ